MKTHLLRLSALALGLLMTGFGAVLAAPDAKAAKWTGCYVGGHAGLAATSTEIAGAVDLAADGVQAGLGAGCDVELSGFVVGAFADYTWQDLETSFGAAKASLKGQWTAGGRAGVIWRDMLVYGLAGYTQAEATANFASLPDFSGYVAGAGVEAIVAPNLSAKLEYRYSRFDSETVIGGLNLEPGQHALRLGLNWRFSVDPK